MPVKGTEAAGVEVDWPLIKMFKALPVEQPWAYSL